MYRSHSLELYRYLARVTDPDRASDLVQETFRTLLERPPAHEAHVRGWLFRVATRKMLDGQRRDRRHERVFESSERVTVAKDPAPLPDQALETKESVLRMQEALDHLSIRDRSILIMRAEGFKHREIADAVDTTTNAVGVLIARALTRLKTHLALAAPRPPATDPPTPTEPTNEE